MKKYIPNILTFLRILFSPVVIYLGITNHYFILIVVACLITFTDFLDGFLARRWHVESALGAKMDMVADKCLAISLLIVLVMKKHAFLYILLLEIVIALVNLYFYFKRKIAVSLLIGKLKTWVIFCTIILGFFSVLYPKFPIWIFVLITFFLQIVTLICYILYRSEKNEPSYQEFSDLVEPILKHKEMQKRKEYPHHIHESVYDHVLRVSYDCFKIGKRWNLDYQSLTIAGILHDFYEKPWQYNKERKPFLKQHAFTHAKEAVLNAKRVYGEKIVTPKVEEIMTSHMFPINIRPPKSKEGWLLTLVDKADSVDFLMHPIELYKIFFRNKKEPKKKKMSK